LFAQVITTIRDIILFGRDVTITMSPLHWDYWGCLSNMPGNLRRF